MIQIFLAAFFALIGVSCAFAQGAPNQGGMVPSAPIIYPGLGVTSGNINYSGTAIQALGTITGGSAYTPSSVIATLGTITGGSLYTDGAYTSVPMTGGTGTGALATVTVFGGAVVAATITTGGTGYTIGDSLSAAAASIGGTGSGFAVPVATTSYVGTPLTGGTGTGAVATIRVTAGGAVNVVTLTNRGTGYTNGDVLSASSASIGGTGSGFSVPVNGVGVVASAGTSWLWTSGGTLGGNPIAPADGIISPYHLYVSGDNAISPSTITAFSVEHASSTGSSGIRQAIQGNEQVVGTPLAGSGNNIYVGVTGINRTAANLLGTSGAYANYLGGVFAANSNVFTQNGATYLKNVTSDEKDIAVALGSSTAEKHAITIVKTASDAVRAVYDDSAIEFSDQDGTSTTWLTGIQFGGYAKKWAFGADSTLIGVQTRVTGAASPSIALNGVDFSPVAFQSGGCAFKTTGFCVDANGSGLFSGTTQSIANGNAAVGGSATLGGLFTGQGSTNDVTIQNKSGATVMSIATGTVVATFAANVNAVQFTGSANSGALLASGFRNLNSGASGGVQLNLGNNTSASQSNIIVNSSGNTTSGAANANGTTWTNAGILTIVGGSTNSLKVDASGNAYLLTAASDATHTDSTVCVDSSSGQLYKGSGTIGICLGTSSARFKHAIEPLAAGLDQIMKLEPVAYKLNADHGDPDKLLYGFTAEQGGKALPALAGVDQEGKPNTFDYLGVVPVLVKGMQQLKAENDSLRACNDNWKCRLFGIGR